MASPSQWTWVWASSGSWWWTEKPGVLQSMGSQSDITEQLNWTKEAFKISVQWTVLHQTKDEKNMNRFWEKWVSMVIYIRDIRNSLSSFYQRTSKTLLYVLSHVQLFATPWTVACKAPLSMKFFRQVYWVGYYSLLHGIFPPQGSNPGLLHYRQILYGLLHQESPDYILVTAPELLVA